MAMGWLKGLVAPTAFGDGAQPPLPGMAPGGPPMGGVPPQGGAPYGAPPYGGSPYGGSPYDAQGSQVPQGAQGMGGPPPYDASALPGAMQWSTGTRTQGGAGAAGPIGGGAGGNVISPIAQTAMGAPAMGAGATLEERCARLQHDVDSLALFARTLLTMLEESKVVTRAQFDATKNRLDMLDGKLDDR